MYVIGLVFGWAPILLSLVLIGIMAFWKSLRRHIYIPFLFAISPLALMNLFGLLDSILPDLKWNPFWGGVLVLLAWASYFAGLIAVIIYFVAKNLSLKTYDD